MADGCYIATSALEIVLPIFHLTNEGFNPTNLLDTPVFFLRIRFVLMKSSDHMNKAKFADNISYCAVLLSASLYFSKRGAY